MNAIENKQPSDKPQEQAGLAAPTGSARTSYPEEPFRLTVVIEYPNAAAAPGIGRQPCLGGTIVALQFNDALTEIEGYRAALEEIKTNTLVSDPEHYVAARALEAQNATSSPAPRKRGDS